MFSQEEKERLAKQYLPLIKKISIQNFQKIGGNIPFDEIECFANLGFSHALNDYDKDRSRQTFAQYAAYRMRFAICDGITSSLPGMKVSYYFQQKLKEEGRSVINISPVEPHTLWSVGEDDGVGKVPTLSYEPTFGSCLEKTPIEVLVDAVKEAFDESYSEIFLASFGIDREEVKEKDLAKRFGVSTSTITLRKKKVIDWIRKNPELMEVLSFLL